MAAGYPQGHIRRPRAWVVRLPGVFIGYGGSKQRGSFQTVVMAESEDMAWELAMSCDVWESLPFQVETCQVFPKDFLPTDGKDQAD